MRLLQLFGASDRGIRLTKTARQLAFACRPAVIDQVAARSARMGHAEARGYIRAKAAAQVRRSLAAHLPAEEKWTAAERAEVSADATEIVVQLVLGEIMQMRLAAPSRKVA